MKTNENKIRSLDTSLFDAIPSQTSLNDKRTLLVLQNCIRVRGAYVYLEIGSYRGGTIQPHYVDPLCKLIYSVDKRQQIQPDERIQNFEYPDNTTARMLRCLSNEFPSVNINKVETYDCDASEIEPYNIEDKPLLCFIDGEHTNKAVFSDFKFCLAVSRPDAIIAFHDACFIFKGIKKIKNYLSDRSIRFRGFMLHDSIYTILLNDAVDIYSANIEPFSKNESDYFKEASKILMKIRLKNRIKRFPIVHKGLKWIKKILVSQADRST